MGFNLWNWGVKNVDKMKNGIEDLASNNPKIRYKINELITELASVERDHKSGEETLPDDVINAVQQLKLQLQASIDRFDTDFKKGIPLFLFKNRVQQMAKECRSSIYSWEPTLTAAPGVLNKLKAYINAFLEEYFAVTYFEPQKNILEKNNREFTKKYNEVKGNLITEVSKDSDDICIPGCF